VVDADIGDLSEPAHGHFVQMIQRSEGAPIQQVSGDILKRFLDLAFRLGAMRPAGPWLKSIMCGEGQKAGVIDGLVTVITGHYDLHVVVQAGGR